MFVYKPCRIAISLFGRGLKIQRCARERWHSKKLFGDPIVKMLWSSLLSPHPACTAYFISLVLFSCRTLHLNDIALRYLCMLIVRSSLKNSHTSSSNLGMKGNRLMFIQWVNSSSRLNTLTAVDCWTGYAKSLLYALTDGWEHWTWNERLCSYAVTAYA